MYFCSLIFNRGTPTKPAGLGRQIKHPHNQQTVLSAAQILRTGKKRSFQNKNEFNQIMNKLFLFALLYLWSIPLVYAQSKRVLREENSRLKTQVQSLQRQLQTCSSENSSLKQKSRLLRSTVLRLRRDSSAMAMEYKLLAKDFQALKAEQKKQTKQLVYKPDNYNKTPQATPSYQSNTSPCTRKQNTLSVGASYFFNTLNKVNTKGWGIQVYSFQNLCNAIESAKKFSDKYTMYKTYIKVKQVNSRRMFCVVYGSLKDEIQARTYCKNFKQIAETPHLQNAFLVQH